MIQLGEISRAIAGAWRLARLDPGGMSYFNTSIEGFWRSFWAAAVVAPGYFYLAANRIADASDGPIHALVVEILAYVIGWAAFPVAAHYLTEALDCGQRYIAYIVAYNWATVIQIGADIIATVIADSDLLPKELTVMFVVGVTGLLWFYQYFITRTALNVAAGPAIALVACNVLIGVALNIALLYINRPGS